MDAETQHPTWRNKTREAFQWGSSGEEAKAAAVALVPFLFVG